MNTALATTFTPHCNKCFRESELEANLKIFILDCNHVICVICLANKSICPICKCKENKKILIAAKGMPSHVAAYFEDPLKQYKAYQRIVKFQAQQQSSRDLHFVQTAASKIIELAKSRKIYEEQIRELNAAFEEEEERIQKLMDYITQEEQRDKMESIKSSGSADSLSPSDFSLGNMSTSLTNNKLHNSSVEESQNHDTIPSFDFTL